VGGQSRFQYGGYWFGFGEAWPVGGFTDVFYVDYIDGQYYLINPSTLVFRPCAGVVVI